MNMTQITCPIDGRPCEATCPDRYVDRPDGGCLLTTLMEFSGSTLFITRPNGAQRSNGKEE